MKKFLYLLFFAALLPFSLFSQEPQFLKEGLFRTQATLSSGNMIKHPVTHIYLSGDIEYYLTEQISIKGESYYFLGSMMNNHFFKYNHSSFAGISFHFLEKKIFDPYVSFQPGAAFSRVDLLPNSPSDSRTSYNSTVNPLLSVSLGLNYYATKYFHLFMSTQYINGKYLSNAPYPISLDELRISFGLGFNLNVKKKVNN